jgi:RNA polymerase-binding transcription factor DksA
MKSESHFTTHRPAKSRATRRPESKIPRKWKWHHRALQRLRDHLVDDLCLKLAATAEPIERHSMDPADSASDEYNRAMTVSLLSGEEDSLHEVDSAIRRILNGTYGICERTGKPIPMERLRAVPWTRFTKEAEKAMEKEGSIEPVKLAPVSSIQGPESGAIGQADEPEKEELQARVTARHDLAQTLEALGQGGRAEPAPEQRSTPKDKTVASPAGRKLRGKQMAPAKPKKHGQAVARRARQRKTNR